MPTGFDKFAKKALGEEGINIKREPVRIVERAVRPQPEQQEAVQAKPEEEENKKVEKLFQCTIKIRPETKRKLDELKFTQQKKFMELAEEAFEDLYRKYTGK